MSTHRSPRITRAAAETLLGGGTGGPQELAALLRAATSPASAAELAGEHQALAALRAARLTPIPRRRRAMLKTALAQAMATKFAAVAAATAATATGGLALVAATGNLPAPHQPAAHSAFAAPGAESSDHATQPPVSSAAPSQTVASDETSGAAPESPRSSGTPSAKATPNPSLAGLCNAYRSGVADSRGKALDNPAFTVLITAAGGKDNVSTYCATVIKATASPDTDEPGKSRHASDEPSTIPSVPALPTHPTGKPSGLPDHD